MTTLNESIEVKRPAHEVFAYVSDFSTCEQWDPTVISARRIDTGAIGVGSKFNVICSGPVGNINLEYEVIELVPDSRVVLVGTCRFFQVVDTINISAINSGCKLDYTAVFTWQPGIAQLAPLARSQLEKMGHHSVQQGLRDALNDNFETPSISDGNARADRFLLSALSRFTKRGYKLGKRTWNPVSAYMGDKHIVLTGCTAGLGKASAYDLARRGAELTVVVRNAEKGKELVEALKHDTGNPRIHLEIADLSLMADVDRVISNLIQKGRAIDVLINNAGALFNPRQVTSEGLEQSFALLLLAPYRLTEGLYPLLQQAAAKHGQARVVNVVSGGLYSQKLAVDDLENARGKYSGSVAYARCKRALMIKTEQWAQDWAQHNIVVNAMHPGWADTPGVVTSLPTFHKLTRRLLRTPEEGADTITWLAMATEAGSISGKLFLDREPRTTHLLESTRESAEARETLREILASWHPDQKLERVS